MNFSLFGKLQAMVGPEQKDNANETLGDRPVFLGLKSCFKTFYSSKIMFFKKNENPLTPNFKWFKTQKSKGKILKVPIEKKHEIVCFFKK